MELDKMRERVDGRREKKVADGGEDTGDAVDDEVLAEVSGESGSESSCDDEDDGVFDADDEDDVGVVSRKDGRSLSLAISRLMAKGEGGGDGSAGKARVKALERERKVTAEIARERDERKKRAELRRARKKLIESPHVVPNAATDIALERKLVQIATRGVVSLFNATAKYQKTLAKKETKTMSKEGFMAMLKGSKDAEPALSNRTKRKRGEMADGVSRMLSDDEDDLGEDGEVDHPDGSSNESTDESVDDSSESG